MDDYPDKNAQDLSARVADIEKCIGDIAQVHAALMSALAGIPEPTCPPYCMHEIRPDYYVDDMKIEYRVDDICKYIADYGNVFAVLSKALSAKPEPVCPPYCGHEK
jgi:hypothetical protein